MAPAIAASRRLGTHRHAFGANKRHIGQADEGEQALEVGFLVIEESGG